MSGVVAKPPLNPFYVAEYVTTLSIGQFKLLLPNPKMLTVDDFEDVEGLMSLLAMQIRRWKEKAAIDASPVIRALLDNSASMEIASNG